MSDPIVAYGDETRHVLDIDCFREHFMVSNKRLIRNAITKASYLLEQDSLYPLEYSLRLSRHPADSFYRYKTVL